MTTAWPPTYTLRISKRARHLHLSVSPITGLEVVVPQYTTQDDIETLLHKKRTWVEKHLAELPEKTSRENFKELPHNLFLRALQKNYTVQYLSTPQSPRLIERPGHTLVLMGRFHDLSLGRSLLKQWLKQTAYIYLAPIIHSLSHDTGLRFNKLLIRGQRSRWGSCTREATIHLNYQCLFLPQELAKHIMLHELCHLKHLNHSTQFWKLLEKFDPNWKIHHQTTRHSFDWIPGRLLV